MSNLPQVTFCGASGHSHAIARMFGFPSASPQRCDVVAFLDDMKGGQGLMLEGRPVLSWEEWREDYRQLPCLVPIGDGVLRRRMVERVQAAGSPSIRLYGEDTTSGLLVDIGDSAIVCPPGYIGPNTIIGAHVQVMPMHSIGHDVVIRPYATIAAGATVSGYVDIGESAFIGVGAVIVPGRAGRPLNIGARAVVAAGAVVMKSVAADAKVYGNPARTRLQIRSRLQISRTIQPWP